MRERKRKGSGLTDETAILPVRVGGGGGFLLATSAEKHIRIDRKRKRK